MEAPPHVLAPAADAEADGMPRGSSGEGGERLERLMADFRELVASDGPLPFLRFAPAPFAAALLRHLPGGAGGADALARRCLAELAPAAAEDLRRAVAAFAAQRWVPRPDREAALAALATWEADPPATPPLRAIFGAQLAEGLGAAAPGARRGPLSAAADVDRLGQPLDRVLPNEAGGAGA